MGDPKNLVTYLHPTPFEASDMSRCRLLLQAKKKDKDKKKKGDKKKKDKKTRGCKPPNLTSFS